MYYLLWKMVHFSIIIPRHSLSLHPIRESKVMVLPEAGEAKLI